MIRNSRTDALAHMRAANPVSDEELRDAIAETDLERAMSRAITAGDSPTQPIPARDRVAVERGPGGSNGLAGIFSRHRSASLGLGLALVGAMAILFVLGGGSVKHGGRPTYAAAAVRVAEANPRLLVTAPGWSIVHANSFEADTGGLTLRNAAYPPLRPHGASLLMNWASASLYHESLHSYKQMAKMSTSIVLGRRATTLHFRGDPNFVTFLPPQNGLFIMLSASLPKGAYESVLQSLRAVSVEQWLAAMPPEVVQPTAESGVISQMLHGVPLPPGLDPSTLHAEGALTNRYELGQAVAGAVACRWLESWDAATRLGDAARAEAAVSAMSGARRWAVLLQMVREKGFRGAVLPARGNGWPSYIVTAAREIAGGHLRRRPAVTRIYHEGVIVGVKTPRNAAPTSVLGCHLGG